MATSSQTTSKQREYYHLRTILSNINVNLTLIYCKFIVKTSLTLNRIVMKDSLEKNTPKEAKAFSFKNLTKYIRTYAKTCRESYYHMLSL